MKCSNVTIRLERAVDRTSCSCLALYSKMHSFNFPNFCLQIFVDDSMQHQSMSCSRRPFGKMLLCWKSRHNPGPSWCIPCLYNVTTPGSQSPHISTSSHIKGELKQYLRLIISWQRPRRSWTGASLNQVLALRIGNHKTPNSSKISQQQKCLMAPYSRDCCNAALEVNAIKLHYEPKLVWLSW